MSELVITILAVITIWLSAVALLLRTWADVRRIERQIITVHQRMDLEGEYQIKVNNEHCDRLRAVEARNSVQ